LSNLSRKFTSFTLTGLNATVYLRLMLFPVPVRGMRQTRFHEE
jgi:hypothetical protein